MSEQRVDLIESIFQLCTRQTTHNVAMRETIHVHTGVTLLSLHTTARTRHCTEETNGRPFIGDRFQSRRQKRSEFHSQLPMNKLQPRFTLPAFHTTASVAINDPKEGNLMSVSKCAHWRHRRQYWGLSGMQRQSSMHYTRTWCQFHNSSALS